MTAPLSDEAWDLLHRLRLCGFLPSTGQAPEAELVQAGYVVARGPNLALTPEGRGAHAAWARLPEGSPEESVAQSAYSRFPPMNAELLKVCTAWQLLPDGSLNDHSDRAYDLSVIDRLDRLHERVAPWLTKLSTAVPRFAGYAPRLEAALDKVVDDRQWMASPRCDSYHTVWMQMHEDLLIAVDASREDEPEPR